MLSINSFSNPILLFHKFPTVNVKYINNLNNQYQKWQVCHTQREQTGSPSHHRDSSAMELDPLLTTAALLAGRSCRKLLGPSGFTAATAAGCISTALCFGANLGDETTLTTDGFTFTLGLATRDRKYLVKS